MTGRATLARNSDRTADRAASSPRLTLLPLPVQVHSAEYRVDSRDYACATARHARAVALLPSYDTYRGFSVSLRLGTWLLL